MHHTEIWFPMQSQYITIPMAKTDDRWERILSTGGKGLLIAFMKEGLRPLTKPQRPEPKDVRELVLNDLPAQLQLKDPSTDRCLDLDVCSVACTKAGWRRTAWHKWLHAAVAVASTPATVQQTMSTQINKGESCSEDSRTTIETVVRNSTLQFLKDKQICETVQLHKYFSRIWELRRPTENKY